MSIAFKQTIEYDPKIVMIVDSLNTAFRWKHEGKLEYHADFVRTVESLRKSYKAGKVVIAADKGSSKFRKEIYPEYKGNRQEKFDQQTPEEALEFKLFIEEFNRVIDGYIELNEYPTFRFQGVEADDIAAYIVKIRKKLGINKIVLISTDRDWDLLIDLDVMRFSYGTRKETTIDNWDTHYACLPEEYISVKVLQGDSGDNVPGVDKIGPARAKTLLAQYGTALDIAANMPIPGKYVFIQNLNKFGAENIYRNYQLMDLVSYCEEAIGPENCAIIEQKMKEYMDA